MWSTKTHQVHFVMFDTGQILLSYEWGHQGLSCMALKSMLHIWAPFMTRNLRALVNNANATILIEDYPCWQWHHCLALEADWQHWPCMQRWEAQWHITVLYLFWLFVKIAGIVWGFNVIVLMNCHCFQKSLHLFDNCCMNVPWRCGKWSFALSAMPL